MSIRLRSNAASGMSLLSLRKKNYCIMQFACQRCLVQRPRRTLVPLRNLGNRQRGNSRVTLPPAFLAGR